MELIKRNIHMDRIRTEALSQITPEDDINIPDNKPDVDMINMEKGEILIDEVKAGADTVTIRGNLVFWVLYCTAERGGGLAVLEGKIPFEERINLQGCTPQDAVMVEGRVDDLHIDIINSRKLSVRSVVTIHARVEELYDEEVPIALHGGEVVEYRRMPVELVQIVIDKNDIFRVKEEMSLPSGYPNMQQILWNDISLRDVEWKVLNEKIALKGDIHVFALYEGEGESRPIRGYETTLPLGGQIECHGCREGMVPDISFSISQQELTIRPDFDGEERVIGMELMLDLLIKLYEEEQVEVISDIYGVSKEVESTVRKANLRRLLSHVTGKTRIVEQVRTGGIPILQLLHSEGQVLLDRQRVVENGILLEGSLAVKVMYITGDDKRPYVSTNVMLPYEYTLEVPGIQPADLGNVTARLEQLQVNMLDGEELSIKAVPVFSTTVFQNVPIGLISQVKVGDIDSSKLADLPGMVIYMVQPGDNLWNIGKRYYVPVKSLRELNGLGSDELKTGQKLLIVKGS